MEDHTKAQNTTEEEMGHQSMNLNILKLITYNEKIFFASNNMYKTKLGLNLAINPNITKAVTYVLVNSGYFLYQVLKSENILTWYSFYIIN